MNGIDISNHQRGINVSNIAADFVIVKATQGTSYRSPSFTTQINDAIASGKLIGVYHYASQGGAIPEAEHFLATVSPYIGRAILALDWEGKDNPNFKNYQYAVAWLKYVEQKTGIKPFIYMSKSVCREYPWDASYPLWCAQYANKIPTGYKEAPWTDAKGFGPWARCQILQYASTGVLFGYLGFLDLDKAYISREEWQAYARGTMTVPTIPWQIGRTYTTVVNLYVRRTPAGDKLMLGDLSDNARRHAYDHDGAVLMSGTRVTIKDVQVIGNNIWLKIPSGWIAGKYNNKIYVI